MNNDREKRIYLDYQGTTPCDDRVVQAMVPYLSDFFGNPHARTHSFGWEAEKALESAREQVAKAVGTDKESIVFTSGATESNNLGIKGLAEFWKGKKKHIVTSKVEHKCALEAVKDLERKGWEVTYLDVSKDGLINPADVENALREDTLLVTLSAVNHEIGAIQDVESIGKICKSKKVFFHVDAAQALGKIVIDVEKWNVDLMSLSAHKAYGPKGVGALYLRCRPRRVRVKPLNSGGGQERGMRSGTTPVFLCVGFGKACELFGDKEYIVSEQKRLGELQRRFLTEIQDMTHIHLNGPALGDKRIVHNVNISVAGVEGEGLMMKVPHLAFASGSACTSANLEPSYVLRALDIQEDLLHSSLRFSFGKDTKEEDVDQAISDIRSAIAYLRDISPVWELIEEAQQSGDGYFDKLRV